MDYWAVKLSSLDPIEVGPLIYKFSFQFFICRLLEIIFRLLDLAKLMPYPDFQFFIPWIMGCQKPNFAPETNLALEVTFGLSPSFNYVLSVLQELIEIFSGFFIYLKVSVVQVCIYKSYLVCHNFRVYA